MLESLQDFIATFPAVLQWLGVMLVAAIPFVESYFGSVVGVLIGLPPAVAIGVAVIGNIASMLIFVMSAHGVRTKVRAGRARRAGRAAAGAGAGAGAGAVGGAGAAGGVAVAEAEPSSPRQEKLRAAFDKYGVAGVSLIGQTMLPSQITSAAMVSFGANRNAVIFWQIVSIVLWGTVFGVLASLGVAVVR